MMTNEQWRARCIEAEAAIQAMLEEYGDVIGPRECAVHGMDGEDCGPETCAANEIPSFLSEWVIVMAWTTKDAGDNLITDVAPRNSLLTHNVGLLRAALVMAEREI